MDCGLAGDEAIATSPDLICILDSDTGEALSTEIIRYGQRVTLIALPAPPLFLTPKGLEHVGPQAFGYKFHSGRYFENEAPLELT